MDAGFKAFVVFILVINVSFASALFSDSADAPSSNPQVKRDRVVQINFENFFQEEMAVNLFEDVWIQVKKEKIEARQIDDYSYFGKIVGEKFSTVHFVVKNGGLTGMISYAGRDYWIHKDDERGQLVEEYRKIDLKLKNDFIDPRTFKDYDKSKEKSNWPEIPEGLEGDDGSVIDIMVLYNQSAANDGGDIGSEIQVAMDYMNTALANSKIHFRMRLVHTEQISFTDTGTSLTDINSFLSQTDGNGDDAWSIRDTYGADLICLWVGTMTDAGGIAILQTTALDPDHSGSLVHRNGAYSARTMAHEVGHNLGSVHDIAETPGNGAYSYSHGYVDPGTGIITGQKGSYTIMAYSNSCTNDCSPIQYFSNPNLTTPGIYGSRAGYPIGNSQADNTQGFNNLGKGIAAFKVSKVLGNGTETADSLISTKCFIASVAYESPLDPHVEKFREFRDRYLLKSEWGKDIVSFYYRISPTVAKFLMDKPSLRSVVRTILDPIAFVIGHPWVLILMLAPLLLVFIPRWELFFIFLLLIPTSINAQIAAPSLDLNRETKLPSIIAVRPFTSVALSFAKQSGEKTMPEAEGEKVTSKETDIGFLGYFRNELLGVEGAYRAQDQEKKTDYNENKLDNKYWKIAGSNKLFDKAYGGLLLSKSKASFKGESTTNTYEESRIGASFTYDIDAICASAGGNYVSNKQTERVANKWIERIVGVGYLGKAGEFGLHFEGSWQNSPRRNQQKSGGTSASHHPKTNTYTVVGESFWGPIFLSLNYATTNKKAPTTLEKDITIKDMMIGAGIIKYLDVNLSAYYSKIDTTEGNAKNENKIYEIAAGYSF